MPRRKVKVSKARVASATSRVATISGGGIRFGVRECVLLCRDPETMFGETDTTCGPTICTSGGVSAFYMRATSLRANELQDIVLQIRTLQRANGAGMAATVIAERGQFARTVAGLRSALRAI